MDPGDSQFPTGAARNDAGLITGANGEVGHALILSLHERGDHHIVAIDLRELDAHLKPYATGAFVGDICATFLPARPLSQFRSPRIFHLAPHVDPLATHE